MSSLSELALELRHHWLRLLERDAAEVAEPIIEEPKLALPESDMEFEYEQRLASELVDCLDRALREEDWWLAAATNKIGFADHSYVYGMVPRRAPMRQIVRGFLQPVRNLPLVQRVPERVEAFLRIMLPGGDDGLTREEHGGVKWHFHYIDAKYRRSDVILSFDTRWSMATGTKGHSTFRPLFAERHAEGKAKFSAHPERWGTEKRISMYEICSRDLNKGIEHFRCAKNGSEPVWPRSALLTPHPFGLAKIGKRKAPPTK